MSEPIATYSFLPWLRQGIANNIQKGDNDPSVKLRAQIPVELTVTSTKKDGSTKTDPVPQNIELYGPGDIIGIDTKAIIKVEPRNWITNYESNYLPYVEFYHEDFPWRYTPARADMGNHRLRPWITLVVLKEGEFEEGKNIKDKPLPFFTLAAGKNAIDLFPSSSQLWAWAHVHVNKDLSNGAAGPDYNMDAIKNEMQHVINNDPDNAYSRVMCPRKLEPNASYHAFLIPSFESGRLAGLGETVPDTIVATLGAWDNNQTTFPYYHRWYFRTGNIGDFEYLVTLLQPKPADKRVGIRDMDVLHPGSNLPSIDEPAELNGVLKLGGALKVPYDTLKDEDKQEVDKYEDWDEPFPHEFETAMSQLVNIADDYTSETKTVTEVNDDAGIFVEGTTPDPDPVITSPLYGTWHALVKRLLKEKDGSSVPANQQENWVHELNLDPRFRVAAGFGTKVVQQGQEEYMNAAWEQVGDVVSANNKLRFAELAAEVSFFFYNKHVLTLDSEKKFVFTTPMQKRVVRNGVTMYKEVQTSVVPNAVSTGAFRTIARQRGPLMKKLSVHPEFQPDQLINKINEGKITATPPKTVPPGVIKVSDAAEAIKPTNVPGFIIDLLSRYPWIKYIPLLLILIAALIVLLFFPVAAGFIVLGVIAVAMVALFIQMNKWEKLIAPSQGLKEENQTPASVDALPKSPDFKISDVTDNFNSTHGNTDSIEGTRFKTALKDAYTFTEVKYPQLERKRLDLAVMSDHIVKSIDPKVTIPKKIIGQILLPERIKEGMTDIVEDPETFVPVMAYPELDIPMYKPLSDLSSELFLPNINLIEQNSITLLETNDRFIEAYMVGLNHEMARELLWREYPTDQRGSYFRQFWDVSNFLPPSADDNEGLREKLKDIFPIHLWPKKPSTEKPIAHELGQHNPRVENGQKANLVLVIRGELLKRYPTAVIYAHKADWGLIPDTTTKDINEERRFVELTQAERDNPGDHRDKIKTPLFEAKVEPDIYFFGFDLDDEQARGTLNPTSTNDDPGWFFVIKERPGEPRFGLDDNKAPRIINWNNLSWQDVGTQNGENLVINSTINLIPYDPLVDQENKDNPEDKQAKWNPDTNAADLAYILYQVPVLVGVHASRMLPK